MRGSGRAAAPRRARQTAVEAQTQMISKITMSQNGAFTVPIIQHRGRKRLERRHHLTEPDTAPIHPSHRMPGRPRAEELRIMGLSQVTGGTLLRIHVVALARNAGGSGSRAEPATFAAGMDMKRFDLTMPEGRPQHAGEPHRILTVYSPDTHRRFIWSKPLSPLSLRRFSTTTGVFPSPTAA